MHQLLVFISIIFILVALYKEYFNPGLVFIIAVSFLGITGVLDSKDILVGLSNEQVIVVILLLVLGNVFRQSSVLDPLFDNVFKNTSTYKGFLTRIFLVISPLSAFINNTPLVALMMPYAITWSKRKRISVSKLLIPLSYATILGGCITLIGTSTHLIVNSLLVENIKIYPELPTLNMFDFFWVGFPMLIIGYLYLLIFGYRLLPNNYDVIDAIQLNQRDYFVEAIINVGSPLHGKTINEAGLRNLDGLFLFRVMRNNRFTLASPDEILLQENDVLYFVGDTVSISKLWLKNLNLSLTEAERNNFKESLEFIEVVITHNSNLINRTLKEENFRAKFDAMAVAIHRNGSRIKGKIGEVQLKTGDTLLLIIGADFYKTVNQYTDFYLVSRKKETIKTGRMKTILLLGSPLLLIILSVFKIVNLFMGLVLLLMLFVLLGITTPKKIIRNIDFQLGVIIVMALALGQAMIKTGVAESLSEILVYIFIPMGKLGLLFGLFIITSLLAAFITNKAAVALIIPIAIALAHSLNYNFLPFILVVSFAAAANFMTPVGYQTNTMVYGPGAYKFSDFLKIGLPLTIIYMFSTVFILSIMYF